MRLIPAISAIFSSNVHRGVWAICAAAVVATDCSPRESLSLPTQASTPIAVNALRIDVDARCKPFTSMFDELVACQRANGTLLSFANAKVGWRVRYFVRYWRMPCGEDPTVQEGYVFHMVTDDLYKDIDLSDAQRLDIRAVIFDGRIRCKT